MQDSAPLPDPQERLVNLLKATADGDRSAFKDLYDATSAKLYGVVSRILGRGAEAEDVLQDVYLRLWQNAGRFDPRSGRAITWMATIARNRAIDVVRQRRPEQVSIDERQDDGAGEILELAAADGLDGAEREALRTCLEGLEEDMRHAVLLAYCHGYSRDELGARFERPVGTVKTWLRRSLALLKECLDG